MDPNVLRDDEGTHLFYSTYFCKHQDGTYYYSWDPKNDALCSISSSISALGYAFSDDVGLTWQFRGPPVFAPGGEEWEQYKVETAFVLNNGTTLQLYYSAIGYVNGSLLDNRYQLGVSFMDLNNKTIKELLLDTDDTFQRYHSDPLIPLDTTTSSFFNNVQEPSVVFRNGLYEVFFLGLQFSLPAESADAAGQTIELIGLGMAVFDASFTLQSITTAPMDHTTWLVNIPEVRYSTDSEGRGLYVLVSSSLGDGGEVHHNEYLQVSYGRENDGEGEGGVSWGRPSAVLKPPGGEGFNGWACTSPTLLLPPPGAEQEEEEQPHVFYSAFQSNFSSNNGACDYSTRYGIGVPDPACLYITLGRATASH